ncbi:Arc family DNA-binding protein [Pseudophaeobacter arcticus]
MLRLPEGMRSKVKVRAAKCGRSMNAEIIHHLERAYDERAAKVIEEARAIFGEEAASQLSAIHGGAA